MEEDRPQDDSDPISRLARAEEIAAAYRLRRERGEAESIDELLAAHPDLADLLDAMLSGTDPSTPGSPRDVDQQPSRPREATPPATIGRFQIQARLGAGGMGIVYRAWDPKARRKVALKVILPHFVHYERARRRFDRETEISSLLEHPNLCRVYEVGFDADPPYLVLELIEGHSLAEELTPQGFRRPTSAQDFKQLAGRFETIARAVQHAHDLGLVHRDLKPANIRIRKDNGEPVVLDFGVAGRAEAVSDPESRSQDSAGTPHYMAPEQTRGHNRDPRVDVWALGVTLYQCITGKRPFEGQTDAEVYRKICDEEPEPVTAAGTNVPPDLGVIVHTALAKDPARRYASAVALAEDLRRFRMHEPILAKRPGAWARLQLWVRRNRAVAALLVLLSAALVGVGAAAWIAVDQRETATRNEREASANADRAMAQEARAIRLLGDQAFARGSWVEASQHYDHAERLGLADDAHIAIRRVELAIALMDFERSRALVEELRTRSLDAEGRARVLLLRGDRTREPMVKWSPTRAVHRALVCEALDSGALPPAESHYARALLAEHGEEILEHLQDALVADPSHRPANEMYITTVLMQGDLDEATRAARAFQGRYPSDSFGVFLEAFCLRVSGRAEQAEALLDRHPVISKSMRDHLDAWPRLLAALGDTLSYMREVVAKAAFGEQLSALRPLSALGGLTTAAGAVQQSGSLAEVMPRVHPLYLETWPQLIRSTLAGAFTGDRKDAADWLVPAAARNQDGIFRHFLGQFRLADGDTRSAALEYFAAAEADSLFPLETSALLLGYAALHRTPSEQLDEELRDLAEEHFDAMLRCPDLRDFDLRFLHLVMQHLELPDHAEEVAARWRRLFPDDPHAAATRPR